MSDFEERLKKAIDRGHRRSDARAQKEAEKALSEQELRAIHREHRLALSDHIEQCLGKLPDAFPGFRYETIMSDQGWGAAVSRDDVGVEQRRRKNFYSRVEMTVHPMTKYNVLDLAAKATVRNKEIYRRNHFQRLAEVDIESFQEMIDLWTLEFAELYAAKN